MEHINTRYRVTHVPRVLHGLGVRFHATGTISNDEGVKIYDYYKADKVNIQMLDALQAWCPDMSVKVMRPSYAPEISTLALCFPKRGFYKQIKQTKQTKETQESQNV